MNPVMTMTLALHYCEPDEEGTPGDTDNPSFVSAEERFQAYNWTRTTIRSVEAYSVQISQRSRVVVKNLGRVDEVFLVVGGVALPILSRDVLVLTLPPGIYELRLPAKAKVDLLVAQEVPWTATT